MTTNKIRHWAVALGLVAVAGMTAASAAGYARHTAAPAAHFDAMPVASGDLGEVIVYAPHDLGEVIVHAPHDLGEVLVTVHRTPAEGTYLAEVVVTAPRAGAAFTARANDTAATLAAVQ